MPPRPASRPNPFYVALLAASVLFVVTCFGYLVGPAVRQQARDGGAGGPGPASLALADWLDRRGPTALAVEVGAMIATGVLAMATDRRFSPRPPGGRGRGRAVPREEAG